MQDIEVDGWDISAEELQEKIDSHGEGFFQDFNRSLIKALLLFYVNSGLFRFDEYKNYSTLYDGTEVDTDRLVKEITDEMCTDQEVEHMLRMFASCHSFTDNKLMSCGACGLRLMERPAHPQIKYRKLELDSSAQAALFKMSEDEAVLFRNEKNNSLNTMNGRWTTKS